MWRSSAWMHSTTAFSNPVIDSINFTNSLIMHLWMFLTLCAMVALLPNVILPHGTCCCLIRSSSSDFNKNFVNACWHGALWKIRCVRYTWGSYGVHSCFGFVLVLMQSCKVESLMIMPLCPWKQEVSVGCLTRLWYTCDTHANTTHLWYTCEYWLHIMCIVCNTGCFRAMSLAVPVSCHGIFILSVWWCKDIYRQYSSLLPSLW